MARLYLARHGETDWNARGKLQGHTDIPLNEAGIAQARALAERLRPLGIVAVTTSRLARAQVTGAIVAEALGLGRPDVGPGLEERIFGVFEGLTRDECALQHPDAWRGWVEQSQAPKDAELIEGAVVRLRKALLQVVDNARGNPTLVVSHGGIMRLWLRDLLGAPVPLIGNGTVYAVSHESGRFTATLWEG
jgi:broad specificity phosphatase PhoE